LAAALLTELGIERAAVMGSSGGGIFAAAFARYHPARVSCLILECAQVHCWDHGRWIARANRWTLPLRRPLLRRWLLKSYLWQFRFQTPRKFLKFEAGMRYADVKDDSEALEISRLSVLSMQRCLPASPGFDNDFVVFLGNDELLPGSVVSPTLVIHDPLDPMAPIAHADWVCECIPSAERFEVESAGHLVWVGRDAMKMHERRLVFLQQNAGLCQGKKEQRIFTL
jgi:pimeloyl-ACP methyl ester carboxylesterase